jgi:hypothetical protein
MLVGIVVAAATVPLAASADRDHQLVIGVRMNFDGLHAEGTFAACCAVNDSGTAQADVTPHTVKGDTLPFDAVETFVGSNGTFMLALRGTTGPLSNPRHIAQGSWRVLDGTGAYADLSGEGTFTGLTDENDAHALTAINTGDVDG